MKMHNPPHLGKVLRKLCIEPMGLSVTAAAESLGVTRKTLSAILNGHSGISPEMAVRLKNMSQLARDTGLTREGLYKAFSQEGNPTFATVAKVFKALGLQITVQASH